MNLSEISWIVSGEQINYLPKSKAEANDWSVLSLIRSPNLFFNEYLRETKRPATFTQERSQDGEKRGFIYAWAEYQLQLNLAKHLSHARTFLGFSYFSQNRQIWAAEIDHLNFEGADYPSTGRR